MNYLRVQKHIVIAFACLLFSFRVALAAEEAGKLVNDGFEQGLTGWQTQGDVKLETDSPLNGRASARIGPSAGSIAQRVETGSGNHFTMSATIQTRLTNGW